MRGLPTYPLTHDYSRIRTLHSMEPETAAPQHSSSTRLANAGHYASDVGKVIARALHCVVAGLVYPVLWAFGPDRRKTRYVNMEAFNKSWNHFRSDDFLGRAAGDQLFGRLHQNTRFLGDGVMEIRDVGDGLLEVSTGLSYGVSWEHLSCLVLQIFYLCVDLIALPALLNEFGIKTRGASGRRPQHDAGRWYTSVGYLGGVWFVFSIVHMLARGRQMFFWRMALLGVAYLVARY